MTPTKREPDLTTYAGRFAARLRELRVAARLSQAEAAQAVGVMQTAVSKWERGATTPPLNVLPVLSTLYGLEKIREIYPDE